MSFESLPFLTCDHPEARKSCEQGINIVYDDGKVGGWPIARVDYDNPANAEYKDKFNPNWNPPPFPVHPHTLRPPLPTEISKVPFKCTPETYYDCTITPHTDSSGNILGHKESCKKKPDVKDDFTKATVCGGTFAFYEYDKYQTTETLPVPVAVPFTEPVPLTKVPYPSLSYPPPPTIPEVEYDPKLDLPWDSTVPNWYQDSTVGKNPNVKYDTSPTTEDKFFKAILGIGIFVAIAGIVYLLFNPTKNTNPGKDLGENAAFQGLSEL